jgi:CBS domain-containing protein
MTNPTSLRRCTVYDRRGDPYAQSLDLEGGVQEKPRRYPTIADQIPLSQIMTRDVICARPELEIGAVVALMIHHHVGCLAARTADEIMMPLALTLEDNASVAMAASMMSVEDLHHVAVTNERGKLVGIVSTKDITNWLVENDA